MWAMVAAGDNSLRNVLSRATPTEASSVNELPTPTKKTTVVGVNAI